MCKKNVVFGLILLCVGQVTLQMVVGCTLDNYHLVNLEKEVYTICTKDKATITLTRYIGTKRPSIILIHGMGCNHRIFDWDDNHSLAQYLANHEWDVWMLDLRTHDGDGDFFLGGLRGIESDKERINRYWDFDRTLLRIDVVTAVAFIKEESEYDKIVLAGHSYGGYLAYAYAELIGETDLAGIFTTGASGLANPICECKKWRELAKYGIMIGKRAFVRPFGHPTTAHPRSLLLLRKSEGTPIKRLFYENTTPMYIQKAVLYAGDDEPAGVWIDMYYGRDPRFYNGHWVDPQTLYDYTENLNQITVPFLAIAGDEDPQDPVGDIFGTFVKVSSEHKQFVHYPEHSHMDLLLGENADVMIFPEIITWLNSLRDINAKN